LDRGNEKADKDGNDGNHNKQFNQRETTLDAKEHNAHGKHLESSRE
jgi:hypothetical protein